MCNELQNYCFNLQISTMKNRLHRYHTKTKHLELEIHDVSSV